jgi:hypothetical protein
VKEPALLVIEMGDPVRALPLCPAYVTDQVYPDGRPLSLKVVMQELLGEKVTVNDSPAGKEPEDEGLIGYVSVHPFEEFEGALIEYDKDPGPVLNSIVLKLDVFDVPLYVTSQL